MLYDSGHSRNVRDMVHDGHASYAAVPYAERSHAAISYPAASSMATDRIVSLHPAATNEKFDLYMLTRASCCCLRHTADTQWMHFCIVFLFF